MPLKVDSRSRPAVRPARFTPLRSGLSWLSLAVALTGPGFAGDAADTTAAPKDPRVQWWTSSEDLQARLTPQPELHFRPGQASGKGVIQVDEAITYLRPDKP